MRELEDGEVLIKNLYISIDPTQRIWCRNEDQYWPHALDVPMRAITLGVVVKSKSDIKVGTKVVGGSAVQDY